MDNWGEVLISKLIEDKVDIRGIIQDKDFQKRPHSFRSEKIENNIKIWTTKNDEEIIRDFKKEHNL